MPNKSLTFPVATYRLQFRPEFDFAQAEEIVPYLKALGISTVYASPIFQAAKGSIHGYDILDHTRLNPELGGRKAFDSLIRRVQEHGMHWIQDIVPNHMAYSPDNPLLADVLSCGPHSRYARFFDIDFEHDNPNLKGRVLAPFLGAPLRETLERGEIRLVYEADGFCLEYYDRRLPLNPRTHWDLLRSGQEALGQPEALGAQDFLKFETMLDCFQQLQEPAHNREICSSLFFAAKEALRELREQNPAFRDWLEQLVELVNQAPRQENPRTGLIQLIRGQFYRLSWFRTAMQEINYRRFFTINDLICVNLEHPEAFDRVHQLPFALLDSGAVQGLRIDHLDGIADPGWYLREVRRRVPDAWLYVEKILGQEEELPGDWPVQGSTGYDFLNQLNGLFVDAWAEEAFNRIYTGFLGSAALPGNWTENKRLILNTEMQGDLDNLSASLLEYLAVGRPEDDVTLLGLRRAIAEVLVQFPVYRTYLSPDACTAQDLDMIKQAVARAREAAPEAERELLILQDLLSAAGSSRPEEEQRRLWSGIVRFQQLCSPLMAKGFEDTSLYLDNRLLALNEVGGNPKRFGLERARFDEAVRKRAEQWPRSMSATATHDTKRGEDVRARLNVLSEIPDEWQSFLEAWPAILEQAVGSSESGPLPAPNDCYYLLQTLLGAFPFERLEYSEFRIRIKDTMRKAVREGKAHSQWVQPNETYEQALLDCIDRLLPEDGQGPFLEAFRPLQRMVAAYGLFNSLSQTLLKMTLPGVPDFYQGSELWDLSLVDPDNRRLVDYPQRMAMLDSVRRQARENLPQLLDELLETSQDGRIKLYLIWKGLHLRRELTSVFHRGCWLPLQTHGRYSRHVLAFAGTAGKQWVIAVAPRFMRSLIEPEQVPCGPAIWQDTHIELPEGAPAAWRERLSERRLKGEGSLPVGAVLKRFPVGLLVGEEEV
ncbi:MAG: malto-oligosyltrehalose synthase [Desulfohalobiaceae bacterium]|nr:malto-oligosyltrehalose synthase [Desulfohalobiaceae bacterium]